MTLPQEISKLIEEEALQYAKAIPDCMPHIAYRRGATEWAGKAEEHLIAALEAITGKTMPVPNKADMIEIATNALAKYKEVSNDRSK